MLFAEHLTAEYRVKTEGRGRKVDERKMRPEAHDNHWFNGVVGAAPCGPSGSLRSGNPIAARWAHFAVARMLAYPTGSPRANLPSETLAFLRHISSMCGCVLARTDTA